MTHLFRQNVHRDHPRSWWHWLPFDMCTVLLKAQFGFIYQPVSDFNFHSVLISTVCYYDCYRFLVRGPFQPNLSRSRYFPRTASTSLGRFYVTTTTRWSAITFYNRESVVTMSLIRLVSLEFRSLTTRTPVSKKSIFSCTFSKKANSRWDCHISIAKMNPMSLFLLSLAIFLGPAPYRSLVWSRRTLSSWRSKTVDQILT